jgi:GNAT superfamily N-acetyltransferase
LIAIKNCAATEFRDVYEVCNDGARAYRGVIAADQWREPYMPEAELRAEIDDGVTFFGGFAGGALAGVMGIQHVDDVALIRDAYTRTSQQRSGIGGVLLEHLRSLTDRPLLVGTWRAAAWAIRFYERHGFRVLADAQREATLRRYWRISDRQVDESLVLGDSRWFARDSAG